MMVRVRRARTIPGRVRQFLDVEDGEAVLYVLEADYTTDRARELEADLNDHISASRENLMAARRFAGQTS